jgi:diaminohydroxyphosphoribosylaminopyrimidine deaminase/5-amino-6-(5-phosphoribosylamino)uracil reductase
MRSIKSVQKDAYWLNRRFFTWRQKKRPYIILKWAETADGFIARKNYDSKWISSSFSRKLVHQWRSQEDAIMVGTNTCRYDNPYLNVRDWSGKNPIRIIIDRQLQLDKQLHVYDQTQPTICYNSIIDHKERNLEYVLNKATSHKQAMNFILQDLYHRQIQSLFVEGGAHLLNLLIEQGWWDEARVFQSQTLFNEGIKAPLLKSAHLIQVEDVSRDRLLIYQKLNKK